MLPEAAVSTAALLGGLFVILLLIFGWCVKCELLSRPFLCCSFPFFHPPWITQRIVGGRKIPRCYILIGDALNDCWTSYMLHFPTQVLLCIPHGDICGRSLCPPPGEEGCQQFILRLHHSRFYGNYECCKSLFHLYHGGYRLFHCSFRPSAGFHPGWFFITANICSDKAWKFP